MKKKKGTGSDQRFCRMDGWMDGAKPQVAPVRKVTEQKLTKANFSYPLLIEHYTQPPLGCKPQPKQIITC